MHRLNLQIATARLVRKKSQRATVSRPRQRRRNVLRIVLRRPALAARLHITTGQAVADIGAGKGEDSWVFAEIVGPTGKVYAEEITEDLVKALKKEVEERKLTQVKPLLGRADSPTLPPESVDLAYMRLVYHHVSKPREMLREIWRALKPGGHVVVVDRLPGTLRDWVPREELRQQTLLVGGDNGRARSNRGGISLRRLRG